MNGCLDVWDYFYKQNDPTLQVTLSAAFITGTTMPYCVENGLLLSAIRQRVTMIVPLWGTMIKGFALACLSLFAFMPLRGT